MNGSWILPWGVVLGGGSIIRRVRSVEAQPAVHALRSEIVPLAGGTHREQSPAARAAPDSQEKASRHRREPEDRHERDVAARVHERLVRPDPPRERDGDAAVEAADDDDAKDVPCLEEEKDLGQRKRKIHPALNRPGRAPGSVRESSPPRARARGARDRGPEARPSPFRPEGPPA